MSRIKKKFIRLGTGTDELNSQDLPANFTPTNYTPAQVGSEGIDKVSAHLKGIDSFLATVPSSPAGDIPETSFSISNNVSTPTTVTGFVFSNAIVRSFIAQVSMIIDATSDLFEVIEIIGIQKGSEWDISISSAGDDSLVDFSITAAGQLQYTSGNYSGFVTGVMKFRATTTSV